MYTIPWLEQSFALMRPARLCICVHRVRLAALRHPCLCGIRISPAIAPGIALPPPSMASYTSSPTYISFLPARLVQGGMREVDQTHAQTDQHNLLQGMCRMRTLMQTGDEIGDSNIYKTRCGDGNHIRHGEQRIL